MKQIINKTTNEVDFMGKVFKDINAIKIGPKDSFEKLIKKFYDVMSKYGICQGTWTEHGSRNVSNPEWVMCWACFKQNIDCQFMILSLMQTPPPNLLAYGNPPKVVKTNKSKK